MRQVATERALHLPSNAILRVRRNAASERNDERNAD
jgi:hypothetical protein